MAFRHQTILRWMVIGTMAILILFAVPVQSQTQSRAFTSSAADQPIPTFISPEGPDNRIGDRALALWALETWSKASSGTFSFQVVEEKKARLRLYWVSEQSGLYGEMRPIAVNGKPGAAVFVRPTIEGLGDEIDAHAHADSLFRDSVVFLTCLHEIGHALGLEHTDNYDDIMFSFGYGGDILNYFQRYRQNIRQRNDIAQHSGLSKSDIARIRELYRPPDVPQSSDTNTQSSQSLKH